MLFYTYPEMIQAVKNRPGNLVQGKRSRPTRAARSRQTIRPGRGI